MLRSARGTHAILSGYGWKKARILAVASRTLHKEASPIYRGGWPINARVVVDVETRGKIRLDRDGATGNVVFTLGLARHA